MANQIGLKNSYKYFSQAESQKKVIKEKASVSIRLMQAYICNFYDIGWLDFFQSQSNKGGRSCADTIPNFDNNNRGEVAVVVSAFERDESKTIQFDDEALKKGRVVFFSNDVRKTGQFLNFNNMPVYGPIKYAGNPFFISISILEFDEKEDGIASAMLDILSSIGGKSFAPSSEILSVLNSVGKSLLSGENDVELRYMLELEPPGGTDKVKRAPLAPGYYVFIRSEQRNTPISWGDIRLNKGTGRLEQQPKDEKGNILKDEKGKELPWQDYIGATYLTFKIDSNETAAAQALDKVQTLEELQNAQRDALNQSLAEITVDLNRVNQNLINKVVIQELEEELALLEKLALSDEALDAKRRKEVALERGKTALGFVEKICNTQTFTISAQPFIDRFNLFAGHTSTFSISNNCNNKVTFVKGLYPAPTNSESDGKAAKKEKAQ